MLRQRLITAVVLIVVVVGSVLWLPVTALAALLGAAALAAAWEWARLVPLAGAAAQGLYLVGLFALMAVLWALRAQPWVSLALLSLAMLWWLLVLWWVGRPGVAADGSPAAGALKAAGGLLVLLPSWLALVMLRENPAHGAALMLYLLALVGAADTAAFLAGRRWGRRRLAPLVSPGKTWEGVYGALGAGVVLALAGGLWLDRQGVGLVGFTLLTLMTVLFSILGDLQVSLLKRHQGVKDSGRLLPGHGGLLDRVDSLTAAAPAFVLGLRWMGM